MPLQTWPDFGVPSYRKRDTWPILASPRLIAGILDRSQEKIRPGSFEGERKINHHGTKNTCFEESPPLRGPVRHATYCTPVWNWMVYLGDLRRWPGLTKVRSTVQGRVVLLNVWFYWMYDFWLGNATSLVLAFLVTRLSASCFREYMAQRFNISYSTRLFVFSSILIIHSCRFGYFGYLSIRSRVSQVEDLHE